MKLDFDTQIAQNLGTTAAILFAFLKNKYIFYKNNLQLVDNAFCVTNEEIKSTIGIKESKRRKAEKLLVKHNFMSITLHKNQFKYYKLHCFFSITKMPAVVPVIYRTKTYTLLECKTSALKYSTIKEWRKNCSNDYQAAARHGWLDQCTSHMKKRRKKWTLENCKQNALNYKTKSEWVKNQKTSYNAASRNNWIQECCGHMIKKSILKGLK